MATRDTTIRLIINRISEADRTNTAKLIAQACLDVTTKTRGPLHVVNSLDALVDDELDLLLDSLDDRAVLEDVQPAKTKCATAKQLSGIFYLGALASFFYIDWGSISYHFGNRIVSGDALRAEYQRLFEQSKLDKSLRKPIYQWLNPKLNLWLFEGGYRSSLPNVMSYLDWSALNCFEAQYLVSRIKRLYNATVERDTQYPANHQSYHYHNN